MRRMWATLPPPEMIAKVRTKAAEQVGGRRRLRTRYLANERYERAGEVLTTALRTGDLRLMVKSTRKEGPEHVWLRTVPPEVARLLVASHGLIPDLPYRPRRRISDIDRNLFSDLENGELVVSEREFEAWCARERARKRWPSQRHAQHPRTGRGRPSKISSDLKQRIERAVRDGLWTPPMGVPKLRVILRDSASVPTLAKALDALLAATGDARFARQRYSAKSK